jgi:hypothetical protein
MSAAPAPPADVPVAAAGCPGAHWPLALRTWPVGHPPWAPPWAAVPAPAASWPVVVCCALTGGAAQVLAARSVAIRRGIRISRSLIAEHLTGSGRDGSSVPGTLPTARGRRCSAVCLSPAGTQPLEEVCLFLSCACPSPACRAARARQSRPPGAGRLRRALPAPQRAGGTSSACTRAARLPRRAWPARVSGSRASGRTWVQCPRRACPSD